MEGWGWQMIHDPKVLPLVLEKWKKCILSGEAFEMEFPLRAANGEFRMFLTRVNPIRNSTGHIVRWFGTNTDIEDLKRAREALAESVSTSRLSISWANLFQPNSTWESWCRR